MERHLGLLRKGIESDGRWGGCLFARLVGCLVGWFGLLGWFGLIWFGLGGVL